MPKPAPNTQPPADPPLIEPPFKIVETPPAEDRSAVEASLIKQLQEATLEGQTAAARLQTALVMLQERDADLISVRTDLEVAKVKLAHQEKAITQLKAEKS